MCTCDVHNERNPAKTWRSPVPRQRIPGYRGSFMPTETGNWTGAWRTGILSNYRAHLHVSGDISFIELPVSHMRLTYCTPSVFFSIPHHIYNFCILHTNMADAMNASSGSREVHSLSCYPFPLQHDFEQHFCLERRFILSFLSFLNVVRNHSCRGLPPPAAIRPLVFSLVGTGPFFLS